MAATREELIQNGLNFFSENAFKMVASYKSKSQAFLMNLKVSGCLQSLSKKAQDGGLRILFIDSETLKKHFDLEIEKEQELVLASINAKLEIYLISKNPDKSIRYTYPGINLETGELIVLKQGLERRYRSWNIAQSMQKDAPIKDFAHYVATGEDFLYRTAGNSCLRKENNPSELTGYSVIMRGILGVKNVVRHSLADDWNVEEIDKFIQQILKACDWFASHKVEGWSDYGLFFNDNKQLFTLGLNNLRYTKQDYNRSGSRYWYAKNVLYHAFSSARHSAASPEHSKQIDFLIKGLQEQLEKAQNLSAAEAQKMFSEVVRQCGKLRDIIGCKKLKIEKGLQEAAAAAQCNEIFMGLDSAQDGLISSKGAESLIFPSKVDLKSQEELLRLPPQAISSVEQTLELGFLSAIATAGMFTLYCLFCRKNKKSDPDNKNNSSKKLH